MDSTPETRPGIDSSCYGYNVKLCDINKFDQHKCPLCDRLLREPIQTERGEIACERCYRRASKDDGICPIDNEPCKGTVNKDKAKEKDVLALICWCTFATFGCSWQGQVRDLEEHEKICDFESDKCQFCKEEMRVSDMERHLKDCPALIAQGCPFIGCTYKSNGSAERLKTHLQENIIFHSHLQTKTQKELQKRLTSLESKQRTLVLEREEKDKEITLLREQQVEIQIVTQQSLTKYHEQEELTLLLQNQVSELLHKGNAKTKSTTTYTEKINMSKLSNEVSLLNKQFSDLDLRQQLFENTTFDGNLVWKIDNIASRMRQALSGRVTALHSAPAFTHRHGYKFCARLYLNGDGLGRGTHVSLFLVIMKSEYDSRLAWPFNRPITFRLVNQQKGSDIVESFNPDQQSSSFKKPVKDMNVASGCPRFIELKYFANGGFVKDDTAFIEINVGKIE